MGNRPSRVVLRAPQHQQRRAEAQVCPQTDDRDVLAKMQRASEQAASADALLDPFWGCLMNLDLQDVRPAQPIDVLLLGEHHSPPEPALPGDMPTIDLLRAAAYRAAYGAAPRCCDIYLEESAMRAFVCNGEASHVLPSDLPLTPESSTLERLYAEVMHCIPSRGDLGIRPGACTLGRRQVRVHAFDPRFLAASDWDAHKWGLMSCLLTGARAPVPAMSATRLVELRRFFMGVDRFGYLSRDPFPDDVMAVVARMVGGRADWMDKFMSFHETMVDRIQRRGRKLGALRACGLARVVIEESEPPDSMSTLMSDASDYYLMLRMLAPNRPRDDSPCRHDLAGGTVPRCCIVYAGQKHAAHVRRILLALAGSDAAIDSVKWAKRLPVAAIDTRHATAPVATVDDVLRGLRLFPPDEADNRDDGACGACGEQAHQSRKRSRVQTGPFKPETIECTRL